MSRKDMTFPGRIGFWIAEWEGIWFGVGLIKVSWGVIRQAQRTGRYFPGRVHFLR